MSTKSPTSEERRPFEAIANRKGAQIKFVENFTGRDEFTGQSTNEVHLDMDMVEASIGDAVERTRKDGKTSIQQKLERLLRQGTDAQKIEFVLGSGSYYFPEDLDGIAQLARKDAGKKDGKKCHKVCDNVCWMVCKCVTKGDQECGERCRQICQVVCD